MRKYNIQDSDYRGATEDILHRKAHIFSDNTEIHAVYFLGEADEHCATEQIEKIMQNPDAYLFTPYLEFVSFL